METITVLKLKRTVYIVCFCIYNMYLQLDLVQSEKTGKSPTLL